MITRLVGYLTRMLVEPHLGEPVVLLRSRIWPGVFAPLLLFGPPIAFTIWIGAFPLLPLLLLAVTVGFAVTLCGNAVLADDTGLLIDRRGRLTRSYGWDEITEAGCTSVGFGRVGLAVYPHGGPYDVPGPTARPQWDGFGTGGGDRTVRAAPESPSCSGRAG